MCVLKFVSIYTSMHLLKIHCMQNISIFFIAYLIYNAVIRMFLKMLDSVRMDQGCSPDTYLY